MPRRRMIDPFFWDDHKVGKLSRDERSLIVGCIGHADDEGRLEANPPYLKATIFKYDDDLDNAAVKKLRDSCLAKMQSWPANHPYRMVPYSSSDEEYICFPAWDATNRPSHPTKSRLPAPSPELLPILSSASPEDIAKPSGESPEGLRPRSGQSSQGKGSIGQVSAVQEDFTKFLDLENDLTDFLMTTLTKNICAGRARALEAGGDPGGAGPGELTPETEAAVRMNWGIQVLKKCWKDGVGEDMPTAIFDGARKALKQYPLEVVAKAFAKGVRYKGGKHKSWKYIQTIIDEEIQKRGRSPPH